MEPIYLAAEADAIPELQRFVVSDGHRVVMEDNLAAAIAGLTGETAPEATVPGAPDRAVEGGSSAAVSSTDALDLLDQAEGRLRSGDWEGFGRTLGELRELLEGALDNGGG